MGHHIITMGLRCCMHSSMHGSLSVHVRHVMGTNLAGYFTGSGVRNLVNDLMGMVVGDLSLCLMGMNKWNLSSMDMLWVVRLHRHRLWHSWRHLISDIVNRCWLCDDLLLIESVINNSGVSCCLLIPNQLVSVYMLVVHSREFHVVLVLHL